MRMVGVGLAMAGVALVAACPSGPRSTPRTDTCAATLAAATAAEAGGFLHRALRSLGDGRCPGADATRARLLDDLGRDAEALQAYRALPPSPHNAARIAAIERRPHLDAAGSGAEDRRAAALLYREGAGLRAVGQYDAAIAALRQSYARWPHPLTIVQIGLAHRGAGRAVEAQIAFERALAIAEVMTGETAVPRWTPRHAGSIEAMAFDPTGRLLATAGADGQVLLWEPVTGQLVRTLASDAGVLALAFAAGGDHLVTVRDDRVVTLRVDDGEVAREVALDGPSALASTGTVAYTDPEGRLWLLGPESAAPARVGTGESETDSLGFSADGARLLQVTVEQLVVWSVADAARVAALPRDESDFDLRLDATGAAIISELYDGDQRIDVASGARAPFVPDASEKQRRRLRAGGPGFNVTAAALHPRGDVLAVASSEGELRVYDLATAKAIHTVGGDTWGINDVSFDAAGERLLVASDDGSVKLWTLNARSTLPSIWAHRGWVVFARISDDGTRVVTGGKDQRVHIWDMVKRTRVRTLTAGIRGKGNSAVDASRDGRAVVATFRGFLPGVGDGHGVESWVVSLLPVAGGQPRTFAPQNLVDELRAAGLAPQLRALPLERPPRTVTLSPDGTRLALGTDEGDGGARVHVIDLATGQQVSVIGGLSDNITACAFTPDGAALAIASAAVADGIVLARVATGERFGVLPTEGRDHVVELAFSADGTRLVSVGRDHAVRVFDVAARRALHTLTAHEAVVTGVAFAPSGALFATSSKDRSVRLWDTNSAELRATLRPTRRGDWVAITPDGRVDGTAGGADLLTFEVGPYRLPGFVGWDRARDDGLLARIGASASRRTAAPQRQGHERRQ